MPLNSPDIAEFSVKTSVATLLKEWLSGYFDGRTHQLIATGVEIPKASIQFDQGPIEQPLVSTGIGGSVNACGTEIRVVIDPVSGKTQADAFTPRKRIDMVRIDFWVRSKPMPNTVNNANRLADKASQSLFGLLDSPETVYPLNQKGMMAIRPSPPKTYTDDNYALRLVKCTAQLHYGLRF